jgi:hypothetical protein
VQEAIIDGFPQADIAVSLVWIRMLPLDNKATARYRALSLRDTRIRHFYDPHKRVGKAFAQAFGVVGKVAWDMYMFFPVGVEWVGLPPMPAVYAHQLIADWIDPARYFRGDELTKELNRLMGLQLSL